MNVCVVGTGYVGLVTGTCLAEKGNRVWCIDVDEERIDALNRGEVPIYEEGLGDLIQKNTTLGRLIFSAGPELGLADCDVCFIAVGTPPDRNGETDMAQVLAAADHIACRVREDCLLVVKSTVPVGTNRLLCQRIRTMLQRRGIDCELEILSNPEFLREGVAVADCLAPDRVVVGASSQRARDIMKELYLPFVDDEKKIIFMDPASAEITKYAANAMLATRISFMNEIAALCDASSADITDVSRGIATDPRIGPHFLAAGCGYGGSCFPKDVQSLRLVGEGYGLDMALVAAIEKVNGRQKKLLSLMLRQRFGEDMEGLKIAVLGLAFKPKTDDVREAPALALIRSLLEYGASVTACDPAALATASKLLPPETVLTSCPLEAAKSADAAVLVTEWPLFVHSDWQKIGELMHRKIIFDGRNALDPEKLAGLGFEYYCIGRGKKPI